MNHFVSFDASDWVLLVTCACKCRFSKSCYVDDTSLVSILLVHLKCSFRISDMNDCLLPAVKLGHVVKFVSNSCSYQHLEFVLDNKMVLLVNFPM